MAKTPRGDAPSLERRRTLQREYELLASLRGREGILPVYAFERQGARCALIMRDAEARSLAEHELLGSLELPAFLRLALQIVGALQALHGRHVVHKDLSASNILWSASEAKTYIVDFASATLFGHEQRPCIGPGGVEGTLDYVSPEQTGRTSRAVDYRSDYYSLGVCLFELLTGARPFGPRDPLELMHAHVARQPPNPRRLRSDVPSGLSAIVLKLLEKEPEARYQSLELLRADLELCARKIAEGTTEFSISHERADRPAGFRIPRRLHARDSELERLRAAFANACSGQTTWIAVEGGAGVGKTSLVRELVQPVAAERGYFLISKFERNETGAPYAAFGQLIDVLVRQLLSESEHELKHWRARITERIASTGPVLIQLCPSLELAIGPQPPLPRLGASESRTRLREAILGLFAALSSSGRPACVVLDDFQRADADAWFLLEELTSIQGAPLLFVLIFRDDEPLTYHPAERPRAACEKLASNGTLVEWLRVEPLPRHALAALIEDTIPIARDDLDAMTTLVHARTAGNPFFIHAFLRSLELELGSHEDSLMRVLEHAEQSAPTDNVIELLIQQLARLPEPTQRILKMAACAGSSFDMEQLVLEDRTAALEALGPAILGSFVIPVDRIAAHSHDDSAPLRAKFAHDRVRQALLSTLAPDDRTRIHRQLADRLLLNPRSSMLSADWFQMIGHMNHALPSLEPARRAELAQWNLKAASAALARAAAAEALELARAGIAALGPRPFDERAELASELYIAGAEAALVSGDHDTFHRLATEVRDRSVRVLDVVAIRRLEGQIHFANLEFATAAEVYADALARLGLKLPRQPEPHDVAAALRATADALRGRTGDPLFELPACEDPHAAAKIDILSKLIMAAGTAGSNLMPIAACEIVQLSLAHGNAIESANGYTVYGRLLANDDDAIELACSFGKLALRLADRFGDRGVLAQTHLYANYQLMHWVTPLSELTQSFRLALRYGLEACSPFNTACSAATHCISGFWAGDDLEKLAMDLDKASAIVRRFRQPVVQNWIDIWHKVVANLCSKDREFATLAGETYDESERLPLHVQAKDPSALYNYHIAKALLAYLDGRPSVAVEHIEANAPYWALLGRDMLAIPITFFGVLCRLAACAGSDPVRCSRLRELAMIDEQNLEKWASHNSSVAVKLAIVRAERQRLDLEGSASLSFYRHAVQLAEREGSLFEAALANELSARAHLAHGDGTARGFLREAHRTYLRWGATAKAAALEREFASLAYGTTEAQPNLDELVRGAGAVDLIDLISVLNASRAISGEIKLDRLLQRLLRLAIESGGAQAGFLLLPRDGSWFVECGQTSERGSVTVLESLPLERESETLGISAAIVNFVARSGEAVLLDDARNSAFSADRRIAHAGVRSLLCFALRRGGEAVAIIYLENNLVRGAFTPNSRSILELLGTQAVVALENARLYDGLEKKVQERTRELHAKNDELANALRRVTDMQEQLVVQEKLAALGTLTASIAHEIKNPLNFVTNFAHISAGLAAELADTLRPDDSDSGLSAGGARNKLELLRDLIGCVEKVREHGLRASDIVVSMAQHSRQSGGQPELTDVHMLLGQSLSVAKGTKVGRFELGSEPKLTTRFNALSRVEIVVQDVARVFTNLILNARYAMLQKAQRAGRGYVPELVVTTHERDAVVEISFLDNGVGVRSELIDQIFVPFYTTKPVGEGTGLGLSICHDIVVRGHRGSLRVDSIENEYSEFVLTLPKTFSER